MRRQREEEWQGLGAGVITAPPSRSLLPGPGVRCSAGQVWPFKSLPEPLPTGKGSILWCHALQQGIQKR